MAEEPKACILCRGVKVKCLNNGVYDKPCPRCTRLNLPCAYSKKRASRKASRTGGPVPIAPAPPPAVASTSKKPSPVNETCPTSLPPAADPTPQRSGSTSAARDVPWPSLSTPQTAPTPSPPNPAWSRPTRKRLRTASPAGPFLPSATAPRVAARTDVSRHLDPGHVGTDDSDYSWHISPHERESVVGTHARASDDPVSAGYVTQEEAGRLVQQFHEFLNPQIALLDPELHTFEYLRRTSTVLFSAVLAASCKFFRKESYPLFLRHAQRVVGSALECGDCHLGLVQASLILVYWKQPADQSAWIKIGIAIRLGYQLGLHQAQPESLYKRGQSDREALNGERTWFCLVAFDRTYAGLFGLPATIRTHELGDCEMWAHSHEHLDIVDIDLRLACSLEHISLTQVIDFQSASSSSGQPHDFNLLFMELERRYYRAVAVSKKWCGTGVERPPGLGDHQQAFLRMVTTSAKLAIRVQMLGCALPRDVDSLPSECLDLAVLFVDQLRVIEGTLQYLQDVLSVRLAGLGTALQSLYWRLSNPQRRLAISLLATVHDICRASSGDETDVATAFVARFLERLLRTMNTASKAVSRMPTPSPTAEHEGLEPPADTFTGAEIMLDSQLPWLNPVDDNVLNDLSTFLDNDLLTTAPAFSAFDKQYWTSLATTLPFNWEEYLIPQ